MEPITREEKFLAAAAGQSISLPTPITRAEMFLAAAAGKDVTLPNPYTREEMFLRAIAENGGAGGGELICELTEPNKGNTLNDMKAVSISYPNAESVGDDAFYGCTALTSINLPVATSVGNYAFVGCIALTSIDLPVATSVGNYAFHYCTALTSINLPVATSVGASAFDKCTALTSINLPVATSVGEYAFWKCVALDTVILCKADAICNFNLAAIMGTKIATAEGMPTGEGFIYVPAALFEDYVSDFAMQVAVGFGLDEATADYMARAVLRKIEDYPEICG